MDPRSRLWADPGSNHEPLACLGMFYPFGHVGRLSSPVAVVNRWRALVCDFIFWILLDYMN